MPNWWVAMNVLNFGREFLHTAVETVPVFVVESWRFGTGGRW